MNKIKWKKANDKNGITLVALVVTIIVLMILAGITISLVLGQNGIITRAQQAKELSINSDKETTEQLDNLENELESSTTSKVIQKISEVKGGTIISTTNNIEVKDDEGNAVIIPAGFKIASDSATKQEEGIVIEDKYGNQFVWIPVANVSSYVRTDFGKQSGAYSDYSETIPVDEQTSIVNNHGYYIGRYEAGDKESTENKTMRTGANTTNTVTIKKGQAPYNWITRDQANTLAIGIKTAEKYNATTKLCSSYAWDTAINFMQNEVSNYGTNSPQGNYNDTTFSYTDITGATQTKASNSVALVPTGETTPVCNIYDMGGNNWEWTTETSSNTNGPCVLRGGFCVNNYATCPAGSRDIHNTTFTDNGLVFRVTLFL